MNHVSDSVKLAFGSQDSRVAPRLPAHRDLPLICGACPAQATLPERKALVANGPGHGCGHNLLGVRAVAAGGTSVGTKGLMVAAKTLALTVLDLFGDPSHLAKARQEFEKRRAGFAFKPLIGDRTTLLDHRD